jgi:hypothetical protein
MKQTTMSALIAAFICLLILPLASSPGVVSAQSNSYTIEKVDHQVQVMYTGHVVVIDTIQLSDGASSGFTVGLPYQYSADVLKAFAYDDSHLYSVNLGVELSNRSGLYGVEVNCGGNQPRTFSIVIVLSNDLLSECDSGNYTLNYPAYPSLTTDVAVCNVSVKFPLTPTAIAIAKSDGGINTANYLRTNLPAYTYAIGIAEVKLPTGAIAAATITSCN